MAVAVRIHRTLELADDKYYMITCGKAGFQNQENKTSLVSLELTDHPVTEVSVEIRFSEILSLLQSQVELIHGTAIISVTVIWAKKSAVLQHDPDSND